MKNLQKKAFMASRRKIIPPLGATIEILGFIDDVDFTTILIRVNIPIPISTNIKIEKVGLAPYLDEKQFGDEVDIVLSDLDENITIPKIYQYGIEVPNGDNSTSTSILFKVNDTILQTITRTHSDLGV